MVPASWVCAQVPPVALQKIFVCITNPLIQGESTDADDPDCIVATSYSDGILNGGSVLFSGTMRSDFRPIQITKFLDKASPKLRQLAAQGANIGSMRIDIFRTSGAPGQDFLVARIVLTQVLITEVSLSVNLKDLP